MSIKTQPEADRPAGSRAQGTGAGSGAPTGSGGGPGAPTGSGGGPGAPTLTQRVTRGLLWTWLTAISARVVQFITTLILARLLMPEDFGLVAVALVIINSLTLLRDMGLSQALIHRQDSIEDAADTAFWLIPLFGIGLSAVAALAAPSIADFFNVPDASLIIRVLVLSVAVSSFGIVPSTLLQRELRFRRKFIPEVAPIIAYCIAATVAAFMGAGAWSLVAGELARNVTLATAIWPFSSWRPHLRFDRAVAARLISYGWHVMGAGVAIFLFTTVDNLGVAKGLGTEQLGFYVLAFTIATLPATQIAHAASLVLFPAYSLLQNDSRALGRALSRTISFQTTLIAPISLATLALGPVFLTSLYGDKWQGASEALQILALYGFFRAAGVSSGELLKSVGRPKLWALVSYIQLAVVVALLYPAVEYGGIAGVAVLFSAVITVGALALILTACRSIGFPFLGAVSGSLYALVFSGLAAAAAWLVAYRYLDGVSLTALLGGAAAFALVYAAAMFSFNRSLVVELRSLLQGAVSSSSK